MSEVTYYFALPFVAADDGIAPAEAIACFNPNAAVMKAEALSRKPGCVSAIAFSRTGDPATSNFGDATVIRKFGDLPAVSCPEGAISERCASQTSRTWRRFLTTPSTSLRPQTHSRGTPARIGECRVERHDRAQTAWALIERAAAAAQAADLVDF
jgi:hypothetical protein